jgi:serine beta-lactamase-like protein LACTB, mitochondrial
MGKGLDVHRTVATLAMAGLLACSHATAASQPSSDSSWLTSLRDTAEREMKRSGSPSLQIAVAFDGVKVGNLALGVADLEHGIAATPTTRYRTASVAKWFTAAAAMRLAERGKLDLDAPIQRYCPGFPAKAWPITTRHLLTHTSGIRHDPDYEAELAMAGTDAERLAIVTRREREALGRFTRYDSVVAPLVNFANDALLFEPGAQWAYSSPDYRVLSCVLEGAAGRSYAELMQADVFDPAGMSRTVPDDSWSIVSERAGLYQVLNAQLELRRADYRDVSENLAAGGYLSTASDLLAFASHFIAGDIVSETSSSLMVRSVSLPGFLSPPDEASAPIEVPTYGRYGYGVMLFPSAEGNWFGHTGRQDGASSILAVSPDRRCTVAVMMNVRSWARGFDFVQRICKLVEQQGEA